MGDVKIEPSCLKGSLVVPSSKSHTLRAILFAALSTGRSRIEHVLSSPDTDAMIKAVSLLGAKVDVEGSVLYIQGCAGTLKTSDDVIQCGNSGLVLRLVGACAALISEYTVLTGDNSIRHHRPIKPLLDALNQLGVFAVSSRGDGYAPIIIKGPMLKGVAYMDGEDSQPISGLLIAGAFAPHPTELYVTNPGEKPWIDLTLSWFQKLGIPYHAKDYTHYRMEGGAQINGFNYTVPGDLSSAAFPLAAALITQSELVIHNIDMEDSQGDKVLISLLQQMGANVTINHSTRTLNVGIGPRLKGRRIDVNDCIDALPILAVIACFAEGCTELVNGAIARKKESDRISAIACELKKMGAHIKEQADGLIISPSKLHGAKLHTYHDHRIALSLSVAAMGATGSSVIHGVECIHKTYPGFFLDVQAIGAKICI